MKTLGVLALSMVSVVMGAIGCNHSTQAAKEVTADPLQVPADGGHHGRITLVGYRIVTGEPNAEAVEQGLDSATLALMELVDQGKFRPASGVLKGRFRLEESGSVRMFMIDNQTSISNIQQPALTKAFAEAAFAGKCSFPELNDVALVYAEFKIDPPS